MGSAILYPTSKGRRLSAEFNLFVILVIALGLRLCFARFYLPSGDTVVEYYPAVLNITEGLSADYPVWREWHVRLGLILPLALVQWLVDSAFAAIPTTALVFAALQTILVYHLGKELWDSTVGLIAAGLDAVHPLTLLWSTQALPDPMLSCFTTAALLFFALGLRSGSLRHYALAGVGVGCAYTAKIAGLFALPLLCLLWLFPRPQRPYSQLLALGCGALAVLALETLVLSYLGGELIARPLLLLDKSGSIYSAGSERIAIGFERYVPGFLASQFWPLDRGFPFHALFGPCAIYCAAMALGRRQSHPNERIVAWWWVGLLLMTNFAALGFGSPLVPTVQMRYLMYITPPAALLIAAHLARLEPLPRRAALAMLVASSLACAYVVYGTWAPYNSAYRHLVADLDKYGAPEATAYFHEPDTAHLLNLLAGDRRTHHSPLRANEWRPRPGDMAVVFISAYTPEDKIPAHYSTEVQRDRWQLAAEWSSNPTLATRLLRQSGIRVKKGLETHFRLYKYAPTHPVRP